MTAVKLKILPKEVSSDLDKIKKEIEEKIKTIKGILNSIEEEPVAFGLKALIVTLAWPEEQDTDILENTIQEIEEIGSVQIIDYRRAIG